jgi:hypothetical protein
MRIKSMAVGLGLVLGIGAAGCAHQKEATQPGANTQNSDRYQYVTGSYLPQDVQKSGPVSNGKDNVRIINSSEIDSSGGANVNQALRQLGANH